MLSDDETYADDSFDLPDVPEHPFYQQQAQAAPKPDENVREEAEGVADHYNARPDSGVAQRGRSPILHLRSFNNWVKSVLIREFLSAPKLKVLDLACGKGGDLLKWDKASASHVTGVGTVAW
jgi:mRNA (guanine-N7-)-methyltransferase